MAKVSVIIPTYGEPIFLEKSISSVLNQTFSDLQLIVVDDNNPDTDARAHTEHIIGSFKDPRLLYVKHHCNKNGAAARNTGISHATGDYICFLDSDDEYMPTRLEKCLNAIMSAADSQYAGVYTGCEFRRKGKTFRKYMSVKTGRFILETLACTFMFCTGSNIFVKRSVIEELNGFDENFIRHQDYEFLVRLFSKYSLLAIPEILVIKNNENINVPDVRKMIVTKTQYLDKFEKLICELPTEDQNHIYQTHYISIGELAIQQGYTSIEREFYEKAKAMGSLSIRQRFRRMAFKLLREIHA